MEGLIAIAAWKMVNVPLEDGIACHADMIFVLDAFLQRMSRNINVQIITYFVGVISRKINIHMVPLNVINVRKNVNVRKVGGYANNVPMMYVVYAIQDQSQINSILQIKMNRIFRFMWTKIELINRIIVYNLIRIMMVRCNSSNSSNSSNSRMMETSAKYVRISWQI